MQQEKLWTSEFLSMGGSNFVLFMSQYIMVAALPIFIMDSLGGGEVEAGLAMTCFQIGTVVSRPIAGHFIDSVNKAKLLRNATVLFFLIMIGFNFWQSLTGIYTLRLFHGIIFALATTATATLAALVLPGSRKGEGIGYFALSTNLAMVVGPLIGLVIIEDFGSRILFLFMAFLGIALLWLANHKKLADNIILPAKKKRHGIRISDFVERRSLLSALFGGLVFFSYGGVLTFIPLYAKSLGLQSETSLFFMAFAAIIVITRPVIGRVFDKYGPSYTVYPGFLCFAAGMIIFSQITTLIGLLFAAIVLGLGFGALSPAFQTLAVLSAPTARSGVATATYFWSLDISVGIAAAVLSGIAADFGYSFMYGVVCTGVQVLAIIGYFFWTRAGIKSPAYIISRQHRHRR